MSKLDQTKAVARCAFTLPEHRGLVGRRALPCLSEGDGSEVWSFFPDCPIPRRAARRKPAVKEASARCAGSPTAGLRRAARLNPLFRISQRTFFLARRGKATAPP